MLTQRLLHIVLLASFILIGCKKDISDKKCEQLKNAMQNNTVSEASTVITTIINNLSSKTHSQQNLEKIAATLSGDCGITAQVVCFGCISTLPEQSEIRISVKINGTLVSKTIDISANSTTDTNMKFVGMHD